MALKNPCLLLSIFCTRNEVNNLLLECVPCHNMLPNYRPEATGPTNLKLKLLNPWPQINLFSRQVASYMRHLLQWRKDNAGSRQENYAENKPKSHTSLRYYSRTNTETTGIINERKPKQSDSSVWKGTCWQAWQPKSDPQGQHSGKRKGRLPQVFLWCLRCIWPPYTGHGICASFPNKKFKSCNANVKFKRPDQTISPFNLLTILHKGARELV